MASPIVHAAVFAAGAAIGGGITAAVVSRRTQVPSPPPQTSTIPLAPSVIQVSPSGQAQIVATAASGSRIEPVLKYGNPGPIHDHLVRIGYNAGYDRRLRHPSWTAEHLTLAALGKSTLVAPIETEEKGDRSKSHFKEDESIPLPFRAKLSDYFRSGYDRGHMVPAADCKISQEAMDETFLLSNMAPQVGDGFNRHYWAYLENWCRSLTSSFKDVYVFTVPLYIPSQGPDGKWRTTHEVIGAAAQGAGVGVPTHFAKVVLTSKPASPNTPDIAELAAGAFILPNAVIPDGTPLESFVVPVEKVESLAGLTLLPDQIKATSKHICKSVKCEVVVRRFDDAQKRVGGRK